MRYRFGKSYIKAYQKNFPVSAPEEDHDDRNALYSMYVGSQIDREIEDADANLADSISTRRVRIRRPSDFAGSKFPAPRDLE